MNFPQADELHRRAGWQATQQDRPVGCTLGWSGGLHIRLAYGKGRAGGLPFSAARPALFRNPPDRLFVQPTGPPFCLQCSLPKVHVFHLETQPARPAGPPISVILDTLVLMQFKQKSQFVIQTVCIL